MRLEGTMKSLRRIVHLLYQKPMLTSWGVAFTVQIPVIVCAIQVRSHGKTVRSSEEVQDRW
jgi:hypothetical protein